MIEHRTLPPLHNLLSRQKHSDVSYRGKYRRRGRLPKTKERQET